MDLRNDVIRFKDLLREQGRWRLLKPDSMVRRAFFAPHGMGCLMERYDKFKAAIGTRCPAPITYLIQGGLPYAHI